MQRVVHPEHVVGDDRFEPAEPPRCHRGEDAALVGDRAVEHEVERRDAVARDHDQPTVVGAVQIADLAAVHMGEALGDAIRHRRILPEPAGRRRSRPPNAITASTGTVWRSGSGTGSGSLRRPGLPPQRHIRGRSPPPVAAAAVADLMSIDRMSIAVRRLRRGRSGARADSDAHDHRKRGSQTTPESPPHCQPFVVFVRLCRPSRRAHGTFARQRGGTTNRISREHRVTQTRQLAATCLAPTRGRPT